MKILSASISSKLVKSFVRISQRYRYLIC